MHDSSLKAQHIGLHSMALKMCGKCGCCGGVQVFSEEECDKMLMREEERAVVLKRDAYQVMEEDARKL